mmetsp:Transcript_40478/g.121962  ORF Transcript_40478/g.121962 Transcript_40478/m.121962 type:complete len:255 (-) Transcript_40478:162-926(-)
MKRLRASKLRASSVALFAAVLVAVVAMATLWSRALKECDVSFGNYEGPKYNTEETKALKCLVQNKWMRLMLHSVDFGASGGVNSLIDDWLFIDYHDRINVLVEDSMGSEDGEERYYVLKQTKYALGGKESYAVVGGIIEPKELAADAARREVHEELGMRCNDLVPLGQYRTDVNRGMGWVNSFVAKDCHKEDVRGGEEDNRDKALAQEVGTADMERQDVISLTRDALRDASLNGQFMEVQWSNTVALALLRAKQ